MVVLYLVGSLICHFPAKSAIANCRSSLAYRLRDREISQGAVTIHHNNTPVNMMGVCADSCSISSALYGRSTCLATANSAPDQVNKMSPTRHTKIRLGGGQSHIWRCCKHRILAFDSRAAAIFSIKWTPISWEHPGCRREGGEIGTRDAAGEAPEALSWATANVRPIGAWPSEEAGQPIGLQVACSRTG